MSTYINTKTGDYPLHAGDLELIGVSVDNLPNYIEPVIVEIPEFDADTEFVYEGGAPIKGNDGKYRADVRIRLYTQEELKTHRIAVIKRKVERDIAITEEEAKLLINR